MTFCEVITISLLYAKVASAPHRYITPIEITALISPVVSPGTMNLLITGFKRYAPIIFAPALMNTNSATSTNDHL